MNMQASVSYSHLQLNTSRKSAVTLAVDASCKSLHTLLIQVTLQSTHS